MTPSRILARTTSVFLMIIICLSCYDEIPDPPITGVYACHQEAQWTMPGIQDHLIGTWKREYVYCVGRRPGGNYVEEDFRLRFWDDSLMTVIRQDTIIYFGSWQLMSWGNDQYMLSGPLLNETDGHIRICEDYITFNASEVDLCDNYFRRIP